MPAASSQATRILRSATLSLTLKKQGIDLGMVAVAALICCRNYTLRTTVRNIRLTACRADHAHKGATTDRIHRLADQSILQFGNRRRRWQCHVERRPIL